MIEARGNVLLFDNEETTREEKKNDPLKERVFKHGNLVHGTNLKNLPQILTEGIKIGTLVQSPRHFISFAMLSEQQDFSKRYLDATHYGPKREDPPRLLVSAIIDTKKLNEAFPGQLYTSGRDFHKPFLLRGNDKPTRPSYGLSHRKQKGTVYPDEVRLFPKLLQKDLVVYPEFILGLVMPEKFVGEDIDLPFHAFFPNLPVFSPNCEYLGHLGSF